MSETLQIDILAKAIDEATAELKKIQSEVKKTEAVSDESASATSKAWEGVEVADKVKSDFDKVRGVIEFIPVVAAVAGTALAALGAEWESAGAHAEAASRIVEGGAKIIAATTKAVTDADQALLSYAQTVAALAGDWQTLNALAAEGRIEQGQKAISDLNAGIAVSMANQTQAQIRLAQVARERAEVESRVFQFGRSMTLEQFSQIEVAQVRRPLQDAALRVLREQREAEEQLRQAGEDVNRILEAQQAIGERVAASLLAGANVVGNTIARLSAEASAAGNPEKPKPKGAAAPDRTQELQRQLTLLGAVDDYERASLQYEYDVSDALSARNRKYRDLLLQIADEKLGAAEVKKITDDIAEAEKRHEAALKRVAAAYRDDVLPVVNDLADEASGFLERMTEGFKANFTGDPIKKALDKQNLEETNQQLGEMGNLLGSLQGLTGGTAAGILGVAGSFVSLGAAINAGLGPLGIVAQLLGIIGDALGLFGGGSSSSPTATSGGGGSRGGGNVTSYNFYGPTNAQDAANAARDIERSTRGTGADRSDGRW
ncbi:MAG: hypothetical protein H6698_09635 [Myxococcales bacterium]|nr:hypothetical protein [Myxococcales bacterium]MCB9532641.1 hypothetical protein [Myxococcales bacterium]MCB9534543.1 hypothetical protein [Myxococcales bacterium]